MRLSKVTVLHRGRVATQSGTAILAVRTGETPVPQNLRGSRRFFGTIFQGFAIYDTAEGKQDVFLKLTNPADTEGEQSWIN
jgi:hypothetical protein